MMDRASKEEGDMGKFGDILKSNRTEKITKLNKGLLKAWQCGCAGGDPNCIWQTVLFRDAWCGISPVIDYTGCPHRRPPSEVI